VVVDNLDIVGASVAPNEAYTPLHVNGNGVLSDAVSFQRVQTIARGHAKVVQIHCGINQPQPIESARLDFGRQLTAVLAGPNPFGFRV